MKLTPKSLFLSLALPLLLLAGCAQKDSPVGSDLTPGTIDEYPQETTLYPIASAFYQAQATTGASPYLYAGLMESHRANFLLKFDPYTALPDSYVVDSLVVKLVVDSLIVAGANALPISVFFVNESQTWAEIGVVWDSLSSLQLGDPIASFDVDPSLLGGDSLSFSLPAPDSLLRAWELVGSGDDSLNYNNGLYLETENLSDQMTRFASGEKDSISWRPRLEMYLTIVDTSDTTGAQEVDSTLYVYPIADAFVVRDFAGISDSTHLYLGNGVACRSILLFNLEGLFPTYGVGIHRAEVVLHADTTSELNMDKINGSFHLEMVDSSWMQDPANALINFGITPSLAVYNEEQATLTLNMNNMVYNWIRYPGTNQGFLIKSFDEYLNVCRTVFYGINAPDSLKPRLHIVYLENGP